MDDTRYIAEGRYRNLTVTVRTHTYEGAIRAAKHIIKDNDAITSAVVRDRKGEVLKVVGKE